MFPNISRTPISPFSFSEDPPPVMASEESQTVKTFFPGEESAGPSSPAPNQSLFNIFSINVDQYHNKDK